MIKETITYEAFDGKEYTEDFYFNLTVAELSKLELGYAGGIEAHLQRIISSGNGRKIIEFFEDLLHDCYGVRSADGKSFLKTDESWQEFKGSQAFSELLIKLCSDPDYGVIFIKGAVPTNVAAKAEEIQAQNGFRPGAQTLPQSEIDRRNAAKLPDMEREADEQAALARQEPTPTFLEEKSAQYEQEAQEQWPHPTPTAPQVVSDSLPEDPLMPHEPGYQQGLTRRQARELGLL